MRNVYCSYVCDMASCVSWCARVHARALAEPNTACYYVCILISIFNIYYSRMIALITHSHTCIYWHSYTSCCCSFAHHFSIFKSNISITIWWRFYSVCVCAFFICATMSDSINQNKKKKSLSLCIYNNNINVYHLYIGIHDKCAQQKFPIGIGIYEVIVVTYDLLLLLMVSIYNDHCCGLFQDERRHEFQFVHRHGMIGIPLKRSVVSIRSGPNRKTRKILFNQIIFQVISFSINYFSFANSW